MIDKELKQSFLTLVRLGIGHPADVVPEEYDWSSIKKLAGKHALLAIVLDGVEEIRLKGLPKKVLPENQLMIKWIGEVMNSYERRHENYLQAISELAQFYNKHGLKMMLLKGLACSVDWPRPEHRPSGDIDIWQFGKHMEADELLEREKGIKVDTSHQHHTSFRWKGFLVENHYDFINVHHHKSNKRFEQLLKELAGENDCGSMEVLGELVNIPSANLHALFLLKHTMLHFASEGIKLRQIIDWGFLVEAHGPQIDWPWLTGVLEEYGMLPAFRIFNAICVEDLGFHADIFPDTTCDATLKERVLDEILSPEFDGEIPKAFISRMAFKLRRWKANAWKHELCYNDSMISAFLSGVWNHLLKPKSI